MVTMTLYVRQQKIHRCKEQTFAKGTRGHSKHPLPTTQEKTLHMDITKWSTPKSD